MEEKECKPYPIDLDEEPKNLLSEPPGEYGLANPLRYTYADYMSWMDDTRRELIDGIVYLFGAPLRRHAEASAVLFYQFYNFLFRRKSKGKCKVYHAPFDVRFPNNGETADNKIYTVVQPDICVFCDQTKLDYKGAIGVPDLIVEIQSPSTAKKDLHEKFNLYERHGVKEYWVVFPNDKAVTVFLLQGDGKYDKGTTYDFGATVPVTLFKGLEINLDELFED